MKPGKCPHCGGKEYWHSQAVRGPWVVWVGAGGDTESTDLSKLRYGPEPKTVQCIDCEKRYPNPNKEHCAERAAPGREG